MKLPALVLALAFLSVPMLLAQTNQVDITQTVRAQDASLKVHRTLMQRIFGINVSYGGALMPRSKVRRAASSFTNAPTRPFENVSVHPLTGRAEGVALLSIHF